MWNGLTESDSLDPLHCDPLDAVLPRQPHEARRKRSGYTTQRPGFSQRAPAIPRGLQVDFTTGLAILCSEDRAWRLPQY
jgi:hypothetical protein